MMNVGIDLGTTNSAIALFTEGRARILHNPADPGNNILPSVVAFHEDRIITGKKAKELLEKAPQSVIGRFKRKMGTAEQFHIKQLDAYKTPVELSAIILRELKTFLPSGQFAEAGVITIPASFDTIQANATKEAAAQAGFRQVLLLQEPIAASLAYANQKKGSHLPDGQWLVYDLGGGTFDVALIRIKEGEMKVLDHEGDNFLGGTDFDNLIVEKILIPAITANYSFYNLEAAMKSAGGKYNAKYFVLLQQAEEAKILLSARSMATIAVDNMTDENGTPVDMEITLTRSDFNQLIAAQVGDTIKMVQRMLQRNNFTAADIQFVLMVGGSTFIPYVRQQVEEVLRIPVNCEIDPITAVAAGAAYYASTKPLAITEGLALSTQHTLDVKATYAKISREKEELFLAKINGDTQGLTYRITREDGGFDTGLKPLGARISEYLPLVQDLFNFFRLTIYDSEQNVITTSVSSIGIDSGYGINGQPIPDDICLEIDDEDKPGETKLLQVFQKNHILPSRKSITRVLTKHLSAKVNDPIRINVLEGPHYALPEANKSLGYLEITGTQLQREVVKGSDIELTFHISESRDLTVTAYLNMADQEFKQTFTPKERHTPVDLLQLEMNALADKLENEIFGANEKASYDTAKALGGLKKEMDQLSGEAQALTPDDVTDKRYQLEDKKRRLAQAIDNTTRDEHLAALRNYYFEVRNSLKELLAQAGHENEQQHYYNIIADEASYINAASPVRLKEKTEALRILQRTILWRTPGFLVDVFREVVARPKPYQHEHTAATLEAAGHLAINQKDWVKLAEINHSLIQLLPRIDEQEVARKVGF